MPFSQLTAQAQTYNGCAVTTEVSFVGTGAGNMAGLSRPGQTVFRVMPPNQTPTANALGGSDANYVFVPDSAATAIFSASPGARLRLSGHIEFTTASGYDLGSGGRPFMATTVSSM